MGPYDRNHDGAALGPSVRVTEEDQRSVYPYTASGGASFPDSSETRRRTQMLHTTYLYLSVAVAGAMAGAWFGAHSEAYMRMVFNSGWMFWIGMLVVLNLIPVLALNVAERAPRFAIPALAFDGVISGLALAPLVFLGLAVSKMDADGGNLVSTAVVVTGAMFAALTAYIHINKTKFKVGGAVMWGLFGFACIAVPVNMLFLQSSVFGLVVCGVVGLMGLVQIAMATSTIVTNPDFNSPAAGALMLFAGLFNLFQVVLRLLIGSRD